MDASHPMNATLKRAGRTLALAATMACWAPGAWTQALPAASPESVGMSSERLAKLTAVMQKEIADKRLPGAVVMVARKGKLVYAQAFGSLNKEAVTGQRLGEFLQQRLFNPLKMVDSGFQVPAAKAARLAEAFPRTRPPGWTTSCSR